MVLNLPCLSVCGLLLLIICHDAPMLTCDLEWKKERYARSHWFYWNLQLLTRNCGLMWRRKIYPTWDRSNEHAFKMSTLTMMLFAFPLRNDSLPLSLPQASYLSIHPSTTLNETRRLRHWCTCTAPYSCFTPLALCCACFLRDSQFCVANAQMCQE